MGKVYKTPGVYIEEISKLPPSVAPVETAIPAFIGYTEKAESREGNALNLKPTKISSMADYQRYFGGPQREENIKVTIERKGKKGRSVEFTAKASFGQRSQHIMYYALQMFFANGGGACFIVSVGSYKTLFGSELIKAELNKGLDVLAQEDEPTLIIFPEAQNLAIADFKSLHDDALQQCAALKDRFVIMDVHGGAVSLSASDADLSAGVKNFRDNGIGNENLKYGAAYAPNLETVLDFALDEEKIDVELPFSETFAGNNKAKLYSLKNTESPMFDLAKGAIREFRCKMPPSSAIAGIYASLDSTRGVWKAPANASLRGVIQPAIRLSDKIQEQMNVDPQAGKSVNAIRFFSGKGTLVWGARTLAGNDNEWRYVNVRRFFNFVEESTKKSTEQFVFEGNDANTWVRVQGMIENFLTGLWRQGALQGEKPEKAFYVAVGLGKTMTALDILEGRMIVEIGMAVVRPAEFIVLRFTQKMVAS